MVHSSDLNSASPAVAIAERQLDVLGELANMALEVSRGYAAAALAASHAVEVTLADEVYQPEMEKARALAGAKDAADGFQKVARILRLTLRLELATAETLGALNAGTYSTPGVRASTATPSSVGTRWSPDADIDPGGRVYAGSGPDEETLDFERRESDFERLVDIEHPDRLPRGAFHEAVDELCADLGAAVNWTTWKVAPSSMKYRPLAPRPPGWSECRPSGPVMPTDGAPDWEQALAP